MIGQLRILFLLTALATQGFLCAQVLPFAVLPSIHVEAEVNLQQANEVWMYYQNTGPDTIRLVWRRIEVNKPAEWDIDLCDYGSCVGGVPPSGLMLPLAPQDSAYIKLIVQPKGMAGQATLQFRVALAHDQSKYADIQFTISAGQVYITNPLQAGITAYPNPARQHIIAQTNLSGGTWMLLDAQGNKLATERADTDQTVFDLRLRQMGLYYLRYTYDSASVVLPVVKLD